MVHYYYANEYGTCTCTQTRHECNENGEKVEVTHKYKIHIIRGNCLFVTMFFWKNEKGEEMEQFISFANDFTHLKKMLKNGVFDEFDDFVMNVNSVSAREQSPSEITENWKWIRMFAEAGKKVTIKKGKKYTTKK